MSLSNDTYLEILIQFPVFLHRYVAGILFVTSNLTNVFNLLIFSKRSWRKNVCVFYLIICNLSNTIFTNSTLIGSIFSLSFHLTLQNSNVVLCKLFYYVSYLFSNYYPTVLICASFDRLLLSSQNVNTQLYNSKRLAYLFVSVSFVLWSIFSLHILLKVDVYRISVDQSVCTYDFSASYLNFVMYSTLAIAVLIPFLLIILSILAFKNVRHIRANPSYRRQQVRAMYKKDFQLRRCLYLHNIVYIVGTIVIVIGVSYTVSFDYQQATPLQYALKTVLNDFGSFLHYIPYCTSFFISVCVSKAFRQELKRMTYKLCGKDLRREEDNPQQEPGRENVVLDTMTVPRRWMKLTDFFREKYQIHCWCSLSE